MNRRGTDKIISVYWFAILLLVAGAVVYMASVFYGQSYNIRELEANLLTGKVADCLSDVGYLRDNVWNGKEFLLNENNFLVECHLNFDVEERWSGEMQYYVEVNFYEFSKEADGDLGNRIFNFGEGNVNLKGYCNLQGEK